MGLCLLQSRIGPNQQGYCMISTGMGDRLRMDKPNHLEITQWGSAPCIGPNQVGYCTISTGMGDHPRMGKPSQYVTSRNRSTQPGRHFVDRHNEYRQTLERKQALHTMHLSRVCGLTALAGVWLQVQKWKISSAM